MNYIIHNIIHKYNTMDSSDVENIVCDHITDLRCEMTTYIDESIDDLQKAQDITKRKYHEIHDIIDELHEENKELREEIDDLKRGFERLKNEVKKENTSRVTWSSIFNDIKQFIFDEKIATSAIFILIVLYILEIMK